jgi:hypothetical protein
MAKKDFTPAQTVELYIGNYRFDAYQNRADGRVPNVSKSNPFNNWYQS